jgi:uncharacterized protein (DUF1800 family)
MDRVQEQSERAPVPAQDAATPQAARPEPGRRSEALGLGALAAAVLAACGGGVGGDDAATAATQATGAGGGGALREGAQSTAAPTMRRLAASGDGSTAVKTAAPSNAPSQRDAARFLAQATMGPRSLDEITALREKGFAAWIEEQVALPAFDHSAYLESQRGRGGLKGVCEEMSYEAVWQHWLRGEDQLRARMVWALLQIFVISNIAPDIRAVAMSSYMDMLGRHAFGNYRELLQAVTLHPAMGYYLNMLESEKENPVKGTHPNENYPREVLQLFSIGQVKLNVDGTPQLDGQGRTIPSYDEAVIKGFAKAFSGWSFGGLDNTKKHTFHQHDENRERLWRVPMIAWPMWHSTAAKPLLDGRVLPAGQTPEKDLADALDSICQHANVGPFIGRQLIQRLVTSNPSPAYIERVARVFADNGRGVRGDLAAVLRAILLDEEARSESTAASARFGKQREPVLRFAAFLRGLGATSRNGRNDIHYLDSADDALGQSPLLAPSVFNFYTPNYRPAGPLAAAGMVAPEFQITTETSVVGALNFFANLIESAGYGNGNSRQRISYAALRELARDTAALVSHLEQLFFLGRMSPGTKARMTSVVNAIPVNDRTRRVKSALLLTAIAPDFVIQK